MSPATQTDTPTSQPPTGGVAPAASRSLPGDHEAVVAPPPGHPRFPLIDSMRALAALFILTAHGLFLAGVWQTAWYRGIFAHNIGLALFFVISGFVIYRPFVAHRVLGAPSPGILAYGRRRFLRIIPPYWLALTVLAIFPGLPGVLTGDWWAYYGLLQLFPIYDFSACGHEALGCGIPTAVTLPGELTFYLMVPLFAALAVGVMRSRVATCWLRAELLLLAVLAVASVGFRAWTVTTTPFRAYLFYGITGMFLWSAGGMALAAISVAVQDSEGRTRLGDLLVRTPAWLSWLVGAAVIVVLGTAYPDPVLSDVLGNPGPGDWGGFASATAVEYVALGAAATLFVLPAVFGGGGTIRRRVMANPVLAWLGVISYGLYLYHLPLELELRELGINEVLPKHPHLVLLPVSLAVTVLFAAASYYAFERPILRFKEPRRARRRRTAQAESGGTAAQPVP